MPEDLKQFNVAIDIPNLTEATIDEESRNVIVKVIQEGVSKNGNYYSHKVVESFVPHLLEKKKMYANHLLKSNQADYIGRDIRDWSAQITEANYENGSTYAKIHIFESEDWLFERIKKFPEEVGVSIDARAKIKEGSVNGQKCRVVEEIIKFNSADFVSTASAGGKAVRLAAGQIDEINDPYKLIEALKTMDEYINSEHKKFYRLWDGFYSYIHYIARHYDDEGISEDEINEALSKGFNDFKKEMLNLDFSKFYVFESIKEHGFDNFKDIIEENYDISEEKKTEDGTEYPASAYLYTPSDKPSTWKLRVKNYSDGKLQLDKEQMGKAAAALGKGFRGNKVQLPTDEKKKVKSKLRNLYKDMGVKKEDIPKQLFESDERGDHKMNKEELKKDYPDLVTELREEVVKELEKEGETETLKAEIEDLKEKKGNEEKEKKELQEKIDNYELKEKVAEKKQKVEEMLKESKLKEDHISEVFRKKLIESETDEQVQEFIKDREDLVLSATGNVKGNGPNDKPKNDKPNDDPPQKPKDEKIDDDRALEIMKD